MVGTRVLDLANLVLVGSNRLQHAAHAAHETDLVLDHFSSALLGGIALSLFVLLLLLGLKDRLHVLSLISLALCKLIGATLFHEMFHHVADLFHEEGDRPFEKIHALG